MAVIEPRVGQLDASILDNELLNLLKDQLFKCFKFFKPEIKDKYESELLLALKLLLFKLTIWDHSTTYGGKLQNLKLVDCRSTAGRLIDLSRSQKLGYGALVIGGGYLWTKLEDFVTQHANDDDQVLKLREILDRLSLLWSGSSLLNFVLFVYSGKYSTLILRLLKMRFVSQSRVMVRQVNFEFQNRQLVWNALTEFLLFILPILNLRKLMRRLGSLAGRQSSSSAQSGPLAFLPEKTCPVCYQSSNFQSGVVSSTDITNPYQGECGHIYCYVCLVTKIIEAQGDGWNCLRCGAIIKVAVPFRDVDVKAIKIRKHDGQINGSGNAISTETPDDLDKYDDTDDDYEQSNQSQFTVRDEM
jgi:peroxin-2